MGSRSKTARHQVQHRTKSQVGGAPVSYEQFRTGLSYREVYHLIYGRQWKRRHGVLGKWRELKQAMYSEYVNDFARSQP